MFTFIVVGNNISRRPNVYNSLAASAFILLCINPAILYDVGFQLSYAAVFAIVSLQPMLYKLFDVKYWILEKIWIYLSISIAAQLGTMPFSLYYFHQFPTYFWMTNMIVVPLVTVLLYLTLLVIGIIPYLPFLGLVFAHSLNWIGDKMLEFLQFVEKLPFAVIENLYYSAVGLALATIFCILTTVFIINKKAKFALLALFTLSIMLLINNISLYNTLSRKEAVIYNIPGKTLLAFTNGRQTTWLTDLKPEHFEELHYFTKPYEGFRKIQKTAEISLSDTSVKSNGVLNVNNNFLNYMGLRMFVLSHREIKLECLEGFPKTDIFLLTENSNRSPLNMINKKALLINARCPVKFNTSNSDSEHPLNVNETGNKAIEIRLSPTSNFGEIQFDTHYFDQ